MKENKLFLDSTTQQFVDNLAKQKSAPLYTLSPEQARNVLNTVQKIPVFLPEVDSEDMMIPLDSTKSISVRSIKPKNSAKPLPIIIYMHGGGWVLGNKETHDRLVREIAVGSEAAVIFANYTLAPEGIYPTAHEEGYAVATWIAKNGKSLHLDTSRIAIAGDSVGGLLATAIVLMSQERGGPKFTAQVLFYPVTNADFNTLSYNEFAEGPWLTKAAMSWFWDKYVPDKTIRTQSLVSPLNTSLEKLKHLPPTFITTNEFDVLRDEGEAYAHKLMSAGVSVVAVRCLGMIHDCLMLNPLAKSPTVQATIAQATYILKRSFT